MTVSTHRLPGFRFETQASSLDEVLPRMDIAVFVGFAASGPLHRPVVVEDVAQFRAIFGDAAPLAWDQRRGAVAEAYLAPAVQAFFRNGGQRCWVIRVAGQALANRFPVPGLLRQGGHGGLVPALAAARSPGSWSDPLSVGAALSSRPLVLTAYDFAGLTFELGRADPAELGPGSLLRISLRAEGLSYSLLCVVRSAELLATPTSAGQPEQRLRQQGLRLVCGDPLWLRAGAPGQLLGAALTARSYASGAPGAPIAGWLAASDGERVSLDLALDPAAGLPAGVFLRADLAGAELWLAVEDARAAPLVGSPPTAALQVSGTGMWHLGVAPTLPAHVAPTCELLSFELSARRGAEAPLRMAGLGFASGHPRCWADLPTDEELYQQDVLRTGGDRTLWGDAADPRFPLAGAEPASGPAYPLGMGALAACYLGPLAQAESALERDGLASFAAGLFLDDQLSGVGLEGLLTRADFLRYQSSTPAPLRGIYAALGIDEATIIAVPDALQRGWKQITAPVLPPPPPAPPLARPEWWHFRDCSSSEPIPLVREPLWEHFQRCGIRVIPIPSLALKSGPDQAGSFGLRWTTLPAEDASYILQEASEPSFAGARQIYDGPLDQITLYGRSQGSYYYRVRAEVSAETSDWSDGIVVQVLAPNKWVLLDEGNYRPDDLLAIQRALLRLCAARGDMLAVLALPTHYYEDAAIAHATQLAAPPEAAGPGRGGVAALSYGETRALSYGALYHPWVYGGDEDGSRMRPAPPDGTACGVLAQRALTRGCWVAPANLPLAEVVALTPLIARGRWLDLQAAQVNLLRQEPQGFLALSASTLSAEIDLRPIGVRRLLHLLRRLALRHGATYVFEPNDDAFRRQVGRTFSALLGRLFSRGAFAGSRPEAAYQVVIHSDPQDIDGGRLIVELRVAPAQPLTFLTVRLVQSGDHSLSVQER